MAKRLDLNKSVYDLVKEYPELKDILVELGFKDITNPVMLNSFGKIMTIPKGAKTKGISMISVVTKLIMNGYELVGDRPKHINIDKKEDQVEEDDDSRVGKLKSYLRRLGEGEELESVQKDFVENFSDVDAMEIMQAEQELMKAGTPIGNVQKLCDVHSSLFHGATREEKIMNAERAVQASLQNQYQQLHDGAESRKELAQNLIGIVGHPLDTFTKENEAISSLIDQINKTDDVQVLSTLIHQARDFSVHYAKKGDLLYPHLKVKYDVSGPSDVMWTVDDEIRDEMKRLDTSKEYNDQWLDDVRAVISRADEMIYKETNILFPICAEKFSEQEWAQIYLDSKDYRPCLEVINEEWVDAKSLIETQIQQNENEVVMLGGHLTVPQLTALLNTIPLEISFVDADNINRYFNEGPKMFKRPAMAIDREVFTCHPPKIEPMVRKILDDFRSGERDQVQVWMEKEGKTFLVSYMAVRDYKKQYLGTVELVQDMEFAKEHFSQ